MSTKDENGYLRDMLAYAREAHALVAGRSHDEFFGTRTNQLALAYLVMIVGEAASRVTPAKRQRIAELPWPRIIGMRNRLIHNYGNVDYEVVWDTATTDLPPLIAALEKLDLP